MKKSFLFITFLVIPGIAAALPSDFKVSGYVDGSYNYLQKSNQFISGTHNRDFDLEENGVTPQQLGVTFAYQPQAGLGGIITPILGRDPKTFAPYGWNPGGGSDWLGFAIPQAYLQYAIGNFTFMGGQFIELAGQENLFSYNDTNFSRGILWGYAEPYTVTGLRVSYIPCDKLTLIAGLNNGWDSIRDTGRDKTIELGGSFTFNPEFSFAAYLYTGEQRIADRTDFGPTGWRTLIDLIASFNASDNLSFILNYDGAQQSQAALADGSVNKAIWQGLAGYINYKFTDQWHTSLRGEYFDDQDGYRTGVSQKWREATLTLGYTPIKNLEFRAETRRDFSNVDSFVDKDGLTVSDNQQSFGLEVIYQFG